MCDTDIFIIGGGPAGLAAALALRARGFAVTVADAAEPPIDKACGEGLMPDSRAALASLGVTIPEERGWRFRGIRFLESGISFASDFPLGMGLGVRRPILQQAMVAAASAAGVRLMWRTPVSGLTGDGVNVSGSTIRARWIIGADGLHSRVRDWTGLDVPGRGVRRFGFRRHYAIAPWSGFMELHWGDSEQIYVTPVASDSVCVVLMTRTPHVRLDDALPRFPALAERLQDAQWETAERGAITMTRRFPAVHRGRTARIGDASGSVDAITGEGLCLAFQQAAALAVAVERGDLALYGAAHRHIARKPSLMAELMLTFDKHPSLRERVFKAIASSPCVFQDMLAMHVGNLSARILATSGISVSRQILWSAVGGK